MSSQMAGFPSLFRLNNFPLCVHAVFSLTIHLSMDIWIVSLSNSDFQKTMLVLLSSFSIALHFYPLQLKMINVHKTES